MRHALGVILLFVLGSAQSAPVVWTLNNIVLSDGQTITGSFTLDATTQITSNISIVNSGTTAYPAKTWDGVDQLYSDDPAQVGVFISGPAANTMQVLTFIWATELTNAGGTVNLRQSSWVFWNCSDNDGVVVSCGDASHNSITSISRSPLVVSGSVSAVPIPTAVWLFASGLGLLGWFRRKA